MGNFFFDTTDPQYLDRVDGRAKVTGTAAFSAEYYFPSMTYGVVVGSTIAKGVITSMNYKEAERAPGVLAVVTHLNCPAVPGYQETAEPEKKEAKGFRVFQKADIYFNGQPIALVIADTLERAVFAATLIKATYRKEEHHTDFDQERKKGNPLKGNAYQDYSRGDIGAWQKSEVKVEAEYIMPIEVHNPMELHAIVVNWEGDNKVTVYEKTQALKFTQSNIMQAFGLPEQNVRVISKFLGGAFGSAFNTWPHAIAALIGSKKVGRPLKLMLSRDQMFTMVGYRPQAAQKMKLGASKDGRLTYIAHEAAAMTSSYQEFTEGIVNASRSLYNCPNVFTSYKVYPLDLSLPTWMRGPGETTGAYALESAMDELAYALDLDPIDLRLINYAETDLEDNKPYSSKFLKEAYQLGKEKFGWAERHPKPRSMREGEWLAGYGTASGIFVAWRGEAKLGARLSSDGNLTLQSGVTDMGPGTATTMTRLASDTLGLPARQIKFELGDSNLPPGPAQGGSGTTSTLGTTVHNLCMNLRRRLVELVKENPHFHTAEFHPSGSEDFIFEDGFIMLRADRSKRISYGEAIKAAGLREIEILEESKGNDEMKKYAAFSYAVHFVKVLVHPLTGVVKTARVVSAIDAGKIVNEKTAESQIIGAVVGGIGMSLMEEGVIDHRYGRWINNNFADYHIPVQADIPPIEVLFVNKPDPVLNPMGSKGMGEVGLVGFAAAMSNAIFHATGKRVRDLPITADKLL